MSKATRFFLLLLLSQMHKKIIWFNLGLSAGSYVVESFIVFSTWRYQWDNSYYLVVYTVEKTIRTMWIYPRNLIQFWFVVVVCDIASLNFTTSCWPFSFRNFAAWFILGWTGPESIRKGVRQDTFYCPLIYSFNRRNRAEEIAPALLKMEVQGTSEKQRRGLKPRSCCCRTPIWIHFCVPIRGLYSFSY